jgi:hypothetical protein
MIKENMNSYLFARDAGPVGKCFHHMKCDSLKGEKWLCIYEHGMCVRGLCYHGQAGCREGDPIEQTKMMIEMVVCQYVLDPRGQFCKGVLSTIQSDGASAFMHVRQELFSSKKMNHNHPLYEQLSLLDLFCLYSSDGNFEHMIMGCKLIMKVGSNNYEVSTLITVSR